MEPALLLRRLYVLTKVVQQPVVVTLLLSAVTGLSPPLADALGNTTINVTGEGFVNGSLCDFGAGVESEATLLRPDLVHATPRPLPLPILSHSTTVGGGRGGGCRNLPQFPAIFPQLPFAFPCPPRVRVGAVCVPCASFGRLGCGAAISPRFPCDFPRFFAMGFDAP